MQIQILSVSVTTKTSKTGKPFQTAEVAYKNLDAGKVEAKNVTQYSDVFKAVVEAQPGQVFNVTPVKDDNGYWQWQSFVRSVEGVTNTPTSSSVASAAKPVPTTVKSTYETPEERAKKQVYIVKQSSISNAVAILSPGAKSALKVDEVLALAQELTDWVFAEKTLTLAEMPNDIEVE